MMNEQADLSHGTMNNPEVQQAVRYALDYDSINKLIGGPAVTPPSVLPQGFLGAYPPERAIGRDVNRAKGLLATAGFPNGFNVDLEYPTNYSNSGVSFDVVAQKIQADLGDAGINVMLKPGDFQTTLANYRAGTESFGFWLWTPDYFDSNDYLAFLPGGVLAKRANWTDVNSDPGIQQLRDQISVETDPTRRTRLWQQAQDYLMANGPWVPVVEPGAYIAIRTSVANYAYNPDWIVNPYVLSKQ
jgi:peptide/nickel transport system substrate-binding protein